MNDGDTPLRLAATVTGSGEPVVAIHGFTGSSEAMAPLIKRLGGWQCIAVDLPGHGRSPAPPELSRYRIEAMAKSVAKHTTAVPDGPCHVIGYSMGGRVALALAVAYPQECRSLTLISTTAGITNETERTARRQADEALADRLNQHGLDQFVDDWMAAPMWDTLRVRLSPAEWEASIRQRRRCNPVGLANALRAGGTGSMTPLWDHLDTLDVPTLIVCGELDTKFVRIARQMNQLLPSSDLAILANTGHAAHLEAPEECANAIGKHLTKN